MQTIETDRLTIRAPVERDRRRFVELFTDEGFTVFSDGVHDVESANARFDRMLTMVDTVPYGKQPVIERATGPQCGDGIRNGQHDHMLIGRNEIGVQHVVRTFAAALGIDIEVAS